MPPTKKITKEMIIDTAFEIVKDSGADTLNARSLAKALNCSTQPIFSCFENMEKLKSEVKARGLEIYHKEIEYALKTELPFKASGLAYINFAKKYPNLFKLIFMADNNDDITNITIESRDDQDVIANVIKEKFNVSFEKAKEFHLVSWIFVHGIASMLAMRTVEFDDHTISMLLTRMYKSILASIQEEDENERNRN